MPLPYTGQHGELNFEEDLINEGLLKAGWTEVLKNKTVPQLIDNWRNIIFERNRAVLNNVPLSDSEMAQMVENVKLLANTPVKANHFINGRPVSLKRDSDSPDKIHAGKDVYLDIFSAAEIAGGSSRYQIAEQTYFSTDPKYSDRRGDVTLLINGMPVIHIELKASGVDVSEATDQIIKYAHEGVFTGFMGLVQTFWAITPEDAVYFANAGASHKFNPAFFFRWGDRNNKIITNWKELVLGENHILSIPEAHKLIGYYAVADTARDELRVCRSYQYSAIRAIVKRTSEQKWGNHDQLGGFVWCTTGGGKTLTSFKAGQLIIDMNLADKVVFVVDRKVLDEQSTAEYNSFARDGENVSETRSTTELFTKLKTNKLADRMIVTSIQKMSIMCSTEKIAKEELDAIKEKRIVFIIDEAHRSQFGVMHEAVKNTFYTALFFGFTGTPIFPENMHDGEMTTETVFGKCLAIYSLATGIRDENVLGFWPEAVKTYSDHEVRLAVALNECKATKVEDILPGTEAYKLFKRLMTKTPMASELDEHGRIKRDSHGKPIKGIEDYLPASQYNNDLHRKAVVENILQNFNTISHGEQGTLFHAILATSSIPEAYEYWKLFRSADPDLHVSLLVDPNTNTGSPIPFDKDAALAEVIDDYYNDTFDTKYVKATDPDYANYKTDLTNRLAHKGAHKHIGNDHDKCLDLVIVVDQLLTGFDSQYINVIYLDKVLEADRLIQAISRTNRVYNKEEKPYGIVKFYRKPYTMQRNLKEALKLYCQGDEAGVQVGNLDENVDKMNETFHNIENIFAAEKINSFERLPKSDERRQKFRKEFHILKTTLRAAILQGFKWTNEYGAKLDFDKKTYDILAMRYSDLPSNKGGGKGIPKPGFALDTDLSTMEMDKIDSDYLEAQFKIITLQDIEKAEDYMALQAAAVEEIKKNLSLLPQRLQKYAKKVLADIRSGALAVVKGKTFREYIREYADAAIDKAITEYCDKYGLDKKLFKELYYETMGTVNSLKLEALEQTADNDRLLEEFGGSLFGAKSKLHKELKDYIENKRADEDESDV